MNLKRKQKGQMENVEAAGSTPMKPDPGLPEERNQPWVVPSVCIFLAAITLAVYGQTLRFEFVNYDDNSYVYENPHVTAGLTFEGIAAAFKLGNSDNWIPVTMISHMIDCQFYGLNAGGHHLTNVLLHTTSVILLFLVLWRMTGAVWCSAFVASVFAVHPLHVESVAWVAERKDTLSGLFFMLTLGAYVRYIRNPTSLARYLMVLILFVLGLMSKPMLVTLPCVLLLLDYWPLNRFLNADPVPWLKTHSVPARLILEKIPLMIVSVASCILTVLAQSQVHAMPSLNKLHISIRIGNALISCVTYIVQSFYPVGLAPYYPYPSHSLPFWKIIGAFVALAAISWGVILARHKRPYLLVGWLWYLVTLVPVIGLVQVGSQALADRYTYLPQTGLCLMIVWLITELLAGWPICRILCGGLASIVIVFMVLSSHLQASYWKNSETLWNHTLSVTSNNAIAHLYLGIALNQKGQVGKAIIEYQQALDIDSGEAETYNDLGDALAEEGKMDEAVIQFQKARAIDPDYANPYNNLGIALLQRGQLEEAIIAYKKALAIEPNNVQACYNLGDALFQQGKVEEAIVEYQKALAIDPNNAQVYNNLGIALFRKNEVDEAIIDYQKALAINPVNVQARYNLGNAFVQKGQLDKAIIEFQKALVIDPNYVQACNNLGNALVQNGQVDEAILEYRKALTINPNNAQAHNNLGNCLLQKGQVDEAILEYRKALAIDPNNAQACNNLGNCFLQKGKVDEAISEYHEALAINPNNADLYCNLGDVLFQKGQVDEAIISYKKALAIQPRFVEAQNNLTRIAWGLATSPNSSLRNGSKALELAQQVDRLSGGLDPRVVATLAAADAEIGKFADAITNIQRALQLASNQNNVAMVAAFEEQLKCYQAQTPYHDSGTAP